MCFVVKDIELNALAARCFHASVICQGKVYLHGGLNKYKSKNPLNDIVLLDVLKGEISAIPTKTVGPARSHHTAVILKDRYICVVGGWDGKKRTADVWLFDMHVYQWTLLIAMPSSNTPAGLSSHTCTVVQDTEMIITGREGGVHMQRRFGSVFKLTINLQNGQYTYAELPMHISSRSGHTTCLTFNKLSHDTKQKDQANLVIVGGRDAENIDVVRISASVKPLNEDLGNIIHQLIKNKLLLPAAGKSHRLRHHAAVSAGNFCVLQGGEMFGKVRDTITHNLLVYDSSGTKCWQVTLPADDCTLLEKMGHTMIWYAPKLYLIGGVQQKSIVPSNIVEITLSI
ncbi:unnamed protein product [Clavelina lepadiformis]|uniref:Uncharacterized protein n=2 Tax=Clavelina lepadiformis TaxID=159417 RepID=A0ABP0FIS4_CLALP